MRVCTICAHPKLIEINLAAALRTGGHRKIATRFRVSPQALQRHIHNCIPRLYAAMQESLAKVQGETILKQMAHLHSRTLALLARAEQSGQLDAALRAVREARGNLELLARLDGTLSPASTPVGPVTINVRYVDKCAVVGERRQLEAGSAELEDGR